MDVLHPNLFSSEEQIQNYQDACAKSGPYTHCVLDPLCKPEFLRAVHEEMKNNMKANFKETDLYKVFQTAELSTLDEDTLNKSMPHLMELRKVLYSDKFRKTVERITGCGELTDRVDCSSNAYANGCHLLCHDDVIGTRRVSFIIYLSDPDEPWCAEDGGAVEFFPLEPSSIIHYDDAGDQGVPVSLPTKTVLPMFNSMLFFEVQPGRSYHAVQEVFAKSRPRLSISGWYHASQPPIGSDRCSLKLIMSKTEDNRPFIDAVYPTPNKTLTNSILVNDMTVEEISYLQHWISPEYLTNKGIKNIQKQFISESSIQLSDFLLPDRVKDLVKMIVINDYTQKVGKGRPQLKYDLGMTDQWKITGPPHMRRYLTFEPSSKADESLDDKIGKVLQDIREELFHSSPFLKYLKAITTLVIEGWRDEVRRFRAGLDYTVAHYGILTKIPRLDATLTFVNDNKDQETKILSKHLNLNLKKKKKNAKKEENPKKKVKKSDGEAIDADDIAIDLGDEDYGSDYDELWEDGDVGGFECFIEADADSETVEAAEVYRQRNNKKNGDEEGEDAAEEEEEEEEEEGTLLSVSARNNSLSLVLRDEGIMKFIKYVSANAPGSRWDVSSEYKIKYEQADENDDEEEEENAESEEEEDDDDDDDEDDDDEEFDEEDDEDDDEEEEED